MALNLIGLARATRDLYVFIDPTASNVDRLRSALVSVFDDPSLADLTVAARFGFSEED